MADGFENAKYYGARDDEVLACETPEERVIEQYGHPHDPPVPDDASIVIVGYVPVKPNLESIAKGQAEDAIERLTEFWWDNAYGNPELEEIDFDGDAGELLAKELEAAFLKALKRARVWGCEPVGERTYDAREIRVIVAAGGGVGDR